VSSLICIFICEQTFRGKYTTSASHPIHSSSQSCIFNQFFDTSHQPYRIANPNSSFISQGIQNSSFSYGKKEDLVEESFSTKMWQRMEKRTKAKQAAKCLVLSFVVKISKLNLFFLTCSWSYSWRARQRKMYWVDQNESSLGHIQLKPNHIQAVFLLAILKKKLNSYGFQMNFIESLLVIGFGSLNFSRNTLKDILFHFSISFSLDFDKK